MSFKNEGSVYDAEFCVLWLLFSFVACVPGNALFSRLPYYVCASVLLACFSPGASLFWQSLFLLLLYNSLVLVLYLDILFLLNTILRGR